MDRGVWQATVHGGHKELDMTELLTHTHTAHTKVLKRMVRVSRL